MMTVMVEKRLYTVEEFEAIADTPENSKVCLELVDGEIRMKSMPNMNHGTIVGNLYLPLGNYNKQRRLGRLVMEVRYRTPGDKRNARIPDLSLSTARLPLDTPGSFPELPLFAFEAQSPDDSLRDLREKGRYFVAHGTKLFVIAVTELKSPLLEVITPEHEYTLTMDEVFDGGDVLPGFSLPVRDIFKDQLPDDTEPNSNNTEDKEDDS